MQDITELSRSQKAEIAEYIKEDNLQYVNRNLREVQVKNTFYTRYGKRMVDILISLVGLVVTLPINMILAVITFLDVGAPIFFFQDRIGRDERVFRIVKFRNMREETDANGELLPPQKRVTKWGKIARKASLDELLNLWPILIGDMSIVGPRPIQTYYVDRFNERDRKRYAVRAGLECPPMKGDIHFRSWQERLENDIWYVEHCSLWVDFVLMFRIVQLALDRRSTAMRASVGNGGFLGYERNGNVISSRNVPDKYVGMLCRKYGKASLEELILSRENMQMPEETACAQAEA